MPTHEAVLAAVSDYIRGFAAGNSEAIIHLFSPAATVEDPVGSPSHRGADAIRAFYSASMATGAKLTLQGPVRTSGRSAAFAFCVEVSLEGARRRIDVIDTFTFDDKGKIVEMRAFWGPQNVHAL